MNVLNVPSFHVDIWYGFCVACVHVDDKCIWYQCVAGCHRATTLWAAVHCPVCALHIKFIHIISHLHRLTLVAANSPINNVLCMHKHSSSTSIRRAALIMFTRVTACLRHSLAVLFWYSFCFSFVISHICVPRLPPAISSSSNERSNGNGVAPYFIRNHKIRSIKLVEFAHSLSLAVRVCVRRHSGTDKDIATIIC